MGLRTRWQLSADGSTYRQAPPANAIPISQTRLDDLLVAAALFPSKRRVREAIELQRLRVSPHENDDPCYKDLSNEVICNTLYEIDPSRVVNPAGVTIIIDLEPQPIDHLLCTYVLLNKPRGYICSSTPEGGAPGVLDLLKQYQETAEPFKDLFTCGRLDCQSEGLLLITNDGKLCRRLTIPGQCEKRYELLITSKSKDKSDLDSNLLRKTFDKVCEEGQLIIEGPREVLVRPKSMGVLDRHPKLTCPKDLIEGLDPHLETVWVEVVLTDGRKRELRRIFGALGYRVLRLVRTEFVGISDDILLQQPGKFRRLTFPEVQSLQSSSLCRPK